MALLAFAFYLFAGVPAHAAKPDKSKKGELTIVHTAPRASELSDPGRDLKLSFSVKGLRKLDLRTKLWLVSDGRMIDAPLQRSYIDEYDRAAFEFATFAPLAEISYQFLIYPEADSAQASQRYSVRRSCLPQVNLTADVPPAGDDTKAEQRMLQLLDQAKGLEKDLSDFERAVGLLQEIKKELQ